MKELKERSEIEKQQWIENYMKKQVRTIFVSEPGLKFSCGTQNKAKYVE